MNLTSRNQDPMHASLALSSLLSVWHKPNSLNNKSIYNTLLLEFYICAKPRLTHWYPCPKQKCHYFCTGVYLSFCNQNWLCQDCFVREEKRCYIYGLSFLWVLLPNVGCITTIFEPWGHWHNTMSPFYIAASQYPRMITWTVFVAF